MFAPLFFKARESLRIYRAFPPQTTLPLAVQVWSTFALMPYMDIYIYMAPSSIYGAILAGFALSMDKNSCKTPNKIAMTLWCMNLHPELFISIVRIFVQQELDNFLRIGWSGPQHSCVQDLVCSQDFNPPGHSLTCPMNPEQNIKQIFRIGDQGKPWRGFKNIDQPRWVGVLIYPGCWMISVFLSVQWRWLQKETVLELLEANIASVQRFFRNLKEGHRKPTPSSAGVWHTSLSTEVLQVAQTLDGPVIPGLRQGKQLAHWQMSGFLRETWWFSEKPCYAKKSRVLPGGSC